jgi:hypothetical protein
MKTSTKKLAALLLFAIATATLHAAVPSMGKWKGPLGPSGLPLPPTGTAFPAESWSGIAGILDLAVANPSKSAPAGAYSFSLLVAQGNTTVTLKSKGTIQPDGRIQWSGPIGRTGTATLSLEAPASPSAPLRGTATLSGQSFPVLAYRETHHRANPLPTNELGLHNLFATGLGGLEGTATGTATIANTGAVRLAATSQDGTRFTGASAIVSEDTAPFLPALLSAKGKKPLCIWAYKNPSSPRSDWDGGTAILGSAPVDLELIRHTRPGKTEPIVPWNSAEMFMQHPSFLSASGTVTRGIDNKLSFQLTPGQFVRSGKFSFNPATGALSASIQYSSLTDTSGSEKPATATIRGLLNKKTGAILGSVLPSAPGSSPGLFDILPEGVLPPAP